ncbi:MAG: hypothetical protein R3C68_13470 [Myxococcota bacterium]
MLKLYLRLVLMLGLAVSLSPSMLFAKDYFVSAQAGSDAYTGIQQQPFLTLGKGVSVLLPGDTLYVRGGTYVGSSALANIPNGASWTEAVTIKAHGEETVVITAEPGKDVLLFKRGSHHIILDGFVLDATGGRGAHWNRRGKSSYSNYQ